VNVSANNKDALSWISDYGLHLHRARRSKKRSRPHSLWAWSSMRLTPRSSWSRRSRPWWRGWILYRYVWTTTFIHEHSNCNANTYQIPHYYIQFLPCVRVSGMLQCL